MGPKQSARWWVCVCDAWSEPSSEERGARGRAGKGARTLGASRPCCVPSGWLEGGGPGPSSFPGRCKTLVAEPENGSRFSSALWRRELRCQPGASAGAFPSHLPTRLPRGERLRTERTRRAAHILRGRTATPASRGQEDPKREPPRRDPRPLPFPENVGCSSFVGSKDPRHSLC